jgi:tetratricopeptide (TPR) repeat protein
VDPQPELQRGKWIEAEVALRKAYAAEPSAVTANNLTMIYKYIGQFDKAEALYLRALSMAPDDPSELLTRCRETFVRQLGEHHHEVGVTDSNLAALALAEGDLAQAEECARRALATKERTWA